MQYRHFGKLNISPSLLGFGCMRFPLKGEKDSDIDRDEAIKMIRYGIDNGINYVDTAYSYHGGQSEFLVGEALSDGYRDKVMLATKNPTWHVKTADDWDNFLEEQLKRLKTDRIDFYLQHCLDFDSWNKFKELNLWEKAMKAKAEGKIKYFGFSFHDDYEVFADILDTYDWDFCQIQLNYLDTDFQAGLKGLEKAQSKNIGVIIMEPLRGGKLVHNVPENILAKFRDYPVQRKPVEWALRWLCHHPGISVVLSGMSTIEQVKENIEICSREDMIPGCMSEKELSFINNLANEWKEMKQINCTGCNYCMPCPNNVNIPECFRAYNYAHSVRGDAHDVSRQKYKWLTDNFADASNCIECGACESACPQHLPIIETLKVLHEELIK
ncbi:MAG: aldo/keto reductase [Clostridiaceae bacterium]|nr:aldo/keto reductase [Clostridiaceae bacterium]